MKDNQMQQNPSNSRRNFLGKAAAVISVGLPAIASPEAAQADVIGESNATGSGRVAASMAYRIKMANIEAAVPVPPHSTNGDESLYTNKIGNYTKGLPHNGIGEVDSTAYATYSTALSSGLPSDFDAIPLGGTSKLTNPQAGLAFDLEGTDAYQLVEPPPPTVASRQRADEAVELYWMALARDVPFSQFGAEPITQAAITELNQLKGFTGPKVNGQVTAQTLFRTGNYGDTIGPWVSQLLLQDCSFGALAMVQLYNTYTPGVDYMTDFASWLAIQNGAAAATSNVSVGSVYLKDGRGISAWVHVDQLYQAYFMGMLWMLTNNTPFNAGNPYNSSTNQKGFGTFGAPHILALHGEVSSRALQVQWFQKWFVHRALRPEEYGGLVHNTKAGTAHYPLYLDILNSTAVQQVYSKYGTWLLPMAFPEGCPTHPSYGSGHATVAGACITILKAFFNTSAVVPNPVYSPDGISLAPYTGSDAGQMTVEVELNKLAMNISQGRNIAGVHWRSDAIQANLVGEALAISILKDQKTRCNEVFSGFTFRKFDGTTVTI
jgi:hypothetical protein